MLGARLGVTVAIAGEEARAAKGVWI